MDIKNAASVKFVDDNYGIAIYDEDFEGNPKPVVHFLIRQNRKDGSSWVQEVGS